MSETPEATPDYSSDPGRNLAEAILDFVGHIPHSSKKPSRHPDKQAHRLAKMIARKAALSAGALALPPGPMGWLTLAPELLAVWKFQTGMVADIAAIYGKQARLTRELMIYCLFHHTAALAVGDLVVHRGERFFVQRVSIRTLRAVAQKIGLRIAQRTIGKSLARWVPIAGALGVGAYVYRDTEKVARTAMELFANEIENGCDDETRNQP